MNLALLSTRQKVNIIEAEMFKQPQLTLDVKHYFCPGIYARELFIPAGTLLTGKIHKHEHLNIMSQGELSVLVGDKIERIKAPFTTISSPGIKRIAFAHLDTVWTTIHHTNVTDIDRIELELVCDTDEEFKKFIIAQDNKCLS